MRRYELKFMLNGKEESREIIAKSANAVIGIAYNNKIMPKSVSSLETKEELESRINGIFGTKIKLENR